MKIKHMIYILLLVFSSFPIIFFTGFMIYQNDKHITKIMEENLQTVSGSHILSINNFCESRKENLEVLSSLEIVKNAILTQLDGETNSKESQNFLKDILLERKGYNSYIRSITVIDKNFLVVASSELHEEQELSNLKNTKKHNLTGEFILSDLVEREGQAESQGKVLAAYIGVWSEGELIGYVVEEISPDYFDSHRSQSQLWEGGTVYLTDGNREIIVAGTSDEQRTQYVTEEESREEYTEKWESIDWKKDPSGEIRYHVGKTEYITYYSKINYSDWTLLMTVNLSAQMTDRYAYRELMLIFAAWAFLALVVAAFCFTRKLTKPISNMILTMEQIQEKEDYTLRVPSANQDEIGALAQKINELLAYIEKENLQEKELQRYLARKAERDPLTGVKNKKAIEEHLQDMVEKGQSEQFSLAIGFLDIDDFRDFNTKYGHQEGDSVIQFVASVLERNIAGVVGRNGGDEFLFGMENISGEEELEKRVKKILYELNLGCYNQNMKRLLTVRCSIGIVYTKQSGHSYVDLVRSADEAMYRAKDQGKNSYKIINLD